MSYYYTLTNVKPNAGHTSILTILEYVIKNPNCSRAKYAEDFNLENHNIGNSAWAKLVKVGFIDKVKVDYRTYTYKVTTNGLRYFVNMTSNKFTDEQKRNSMKILINILAK